MATKTTPLNDSTHLRLKELQVLILQKYHRHKSISEIVTDVLNMIKDNGELVIHIMETKKQRENRLGNQNANIIGNINEGERGIMSLEGKSAEHKNVSMPSNIVLIKEEDVSK